MWPFVMPIVTTPLVAGGAPFNFSVNGGSGLSNLRFLDSGFWTLDKYFWLGLADSQMTLFVKSVELCPTVLFGRRQTMQKKEALKWYLRPVVVILLLFLVLGPFGIPLLYKSPAFNRKLKAILTGVVIIYTAYLILASVEIAEEVYRRLGEIQGVLK